MSSSGMASDSRDEDIVDLEPRGASLPQTPAQTLSRYVVTSLYTHKCMSSLITRPELTQLVLFSPRSPPLDSKKRTVVNILKSYIGAGVLAIPFAFAQGGLTVRSQTRDQMFASVLTSFVA